MASLSVAGRGPTPDGITFDGNFRVLARVVERDDDSDDAWTPVTAYTIEVVSVNIARNEFDTYPISVASLSAKAGGPLQLKAHCILADVKTAIIRHASLDIDCAMEEHVISFSVDRALDVMLEIDGNKWQRSRRRSIWGI